MHFLNVGITGAHVYLAICTAKAIICVMFRYLKQTQRQFVFNVTKWQNITIFHISTEARRSRNQDIVCLNVIKISGNIRYSSPKV